MLGAGQLRRLVEQFVQFLFVQLFFLKFLVELVLQLQQFFELIIVEQFVFQQHVEFLVLQYFVLEWHGFVVVEQLVFR